VEYNPSRFPLEWAYQTTDEKLIADRPAPFGGEANAATRARNPNSQKGNGEDYGANHGGGSGFVFGKILLAREDNINDNGRSPTHVSSKRSNSRTIYKEVNSKNKGKGQLTNMYTIDKLGGSYRGGPAIGKGEMDPVDRGPNGHPKSPWILNVYSGPLFFDMEKSLQETHSGGRATMPPKRGDGGKTLIPWKRKAAGYPKMFLEKGQRNMKMREGCEEAEVGGPVLKGCKLSKEDVNTNGLRMDSLANRNEYPKLELPRAWEPLDSSRVLQFGEAKVSHFGLFNGDQVTEK
jgi:hypothetical protein